MKHFMHKFTFRPLVLVLYLFSVRIAFAQTFSFTNPLAAGTNTLYDFIKLIINNVIIPIGGVISVIFIIYSGFLFVTARGNQTKLETAKKSLLWGAIGAAILLGSWAIALAIQGTINQLVP